MTLLIKIGKELLHVPHGRYLPLPEDPGRNIIGRKELLRRTPLQAEGSQQGFLRYDT